MEITRPFFASTLLLAVSLGPAFAGDGDSELLNAKLRRADAVARRGDLSFSNRVDRYQTDLPGVDERVKDITLKYRKLGYNESVVKHMAQQARKEALADETGRHTNLTLRLRYADPNRYRLDQTSSQNERPFFKVSDGQNQFLVYGKTLAINDQGFSSYERYLGPAPEANYAIGRGLSTLKSLQTARIADSVVVIGTLEDGSPIKALVDPNHGYVARSITRVGTSSWVYGKPVKTKDGYWIPSWAEYRTYDRNGRVRYRSRFDFRGGSFSTLSPKTFTVQLADYAQIDDNRFPTSPTFFKLPSGVHSATDLLTFSRRQSEAEVKTLAKKPETAASRRLLALGLYLAFIASIVLSGWLVWRSRRYLKKV